MSDSPAASLFPALAKVLAAAAAAGSQAEGLNLVGGWVGGAPSCCLARVVLGGSSLQGACPVAPFGQAVRVVSEAGGCGGQLMCGAMIRARNKSCMHEKWIC